MYAFTALKSETGKSLDLPSERDRISPVCLLRAFKIAYVYGGMYDR